MQKSKKRLIISALCIVGLCLLLVINWFSLHRINKNNVEKIQIGNSQTASGFNAEDTAKFVELFNSASYTGKAKGWGITPEWTVYVHYRDGSYLMVSDASGVGNFEIKLCDAFLRTAHYYIHSEELETFILDLMDKP